MSVPLKLATFALVLGLLFGAGALVGAAPVAVSPSTRQRGGVMPRIQPIEMDAAPGKAKELLDELASRAGEPGPMVRAMANAPALLRAYLDLTRAMRRTHVDRRIIERINVAAHEWLGCEYCLMAHTRADRQLGLSDVDIELASGIAIMSDSSIRSTPVIDQPSKPCRTRARRARPVARSRTT